MRRRRVRLRKGAGSPAMPFALKRRHQGSRLGSLSTFSCPPQLGGDLTAISGSSLNGPRASCIGEVGTLQMLRLTRQLLCTLPQ